MIFTGIAVAIAIAIGAGYFMIAEQEPAWQAYSTESLRVGDPGNNLVGPNWTGMSDGSAAETEETAS